MGEGVAKPRPNPRKKVVGNRGFGAEPAGAFENASRGAERYAVARSNTTDDYNAHTRGYAVAPPRATFLNRYAIPCTAFSACAQFIVICDKLR